MKRRIPRDYLLAFFRDRLKLEKLLSAADDLAEPDRFLNLLRSLERSGGISALEVPLRPEHIRSNAWDSAVMLSLERSRRGYPCTDKDAIMISPSFRSD